MTIGSCGFGSILDPITCGFENDRRKMFRLKKLVSDFIHIFLVNAIYVS